METLTWKKYIYRIYTAKSRPSTPKRQRCLSSAMSSSIFLLLMKSVKCSSMIAAVFLFSSYHELTKSGNFFQCKKHLTADRMQQCKEEPNTPVMFRDMMVLQINATDFAFNGKIEFVEAVGAPWKVQYVMNIVYVILWTDSSKWIFSISRKHGLLH